MIVAVFDVDGTMIPGDSLKLFGWYLIRQGCVKLSQCPGVVASSARYLTGLSDAGVLKASFLRALLYGTGASQTSIQADRFAREILIPRMYRRALERVRWHRERDHRIVLLSASPDLYLCSLADMIGADSLICTPLALEHGVFRGELAGPNCKGAEKLRRLIAENSLKGTDRSQSYGYGNSSDDIPFLRALGHPTAVNPDRRLKQSAVEYGWKVEHWY